MLIFQFFGWCLSKCCSTMFYKQKDRIMKSLNHLGIFLVILFVILIIATGSARAATFDITVSDGTGDKLSSVSITVASENGDVGYRSLAMQLAHLRSQI